eukprot:scaffold21688_cov63-Phaeocystis_antarctica.AAC.1
MDFLLELANADSLSEPRGPNTSSDTGAHRCTSSGIGRRWWGLVEEPPHEIKGWDPPLLNAFERLVFPTA